MQRVFLLKLYYKLQMVYLVEKFLHFTHTHTHDMYIEVETFMNNSIYFEID